MATDLHRQGYQIAITPMATLRLTTCSQPIARPRRRTHVPTPAIASRLPDGTRGPTGRDRAVGHHALVLHRPRVLLGRPPPRDFSWPATGGADQSAGVGGAPRHPLHAARRYPGDPGQPAATGLGSGERHPERRGAGRRAAIGGASFAGRHHRRRLSEFRRGPEGSIEPEELPTFVVLDQKPLAASRCDQRYPHRHDDRRRKIH